MCGDEGASGWSGKGEERGVGGVSGWVIGCRWGRGGASGWLGEGEERGRGQGRMVFFFYFKYDVNVLIF